jgi:hypothetical protein
MPYASSSGTTSVTVTTKELILDELPASKKCGETFNFTGQYKVGGSGVQGAPVDIYMDTTKILSGTTASGGYFTLPWTVPQGLGCTTRNFQAKNPSSGAESAVRSMKIAWNTRISISAPPSVNPGQTFAVTGKLEYESSSGVWTGLAGKAVSIVYDSTSFGSGTTGSDGSYSISGSISAGGTYTLKATYAGEGLGFSPAEALVKLFTAGEVEPALIEIGTAALAFAPILFVGSVILANSIGRK